MESGSTEDRSTRVAILGSGAWGTTLSLVAHRAGSSSTLIVRNAATAESLETERRHPTSIPGVTLPEGVAIDRDAGRAIDAAELVIVAIPTQKLRAALSPLAVRLHGKTLLCASKGIEVGTLLLPHAIIADVLGPESAATICALSGPNLATEIAQGLPATAVVASADAAAATRAQAALMGPMFRVYTSDDLIGVETGGALKNIIAIGAGVADGLHAGDNAKASFLTRGIVEISRLGVAMGANPMTFAGLSGIGDLMATCSSSLSRNHRVGVELSQGRSLDDVLAGMTEVAEGVDTTRAALVLADRLHVELPIAREIGQIMFEGKSPLDAVRDLMLREPRREHIELEGANPEA